MSTRRPSRHPHRSLNTPLAPSGPPEPGLEGERRRTRSDQASYQSVVPDTVNAPDAVLASASTVESALPATPRIHPGNFHNAFQVEPDASLDGKTITTLSPRLQAHLEKLLDLTGNHQEPDYQAAWNAIFDMLGFGKSMRPSPSGFAGEDSISAVRIDFRATEVDVQSFENPTRHVKLKDLELHGSIVSLTRVLRQKKRTAEQCLSTLPEHHPNANKKPRTSPNMTSSIEDQNDLVPATSDAESCEHSSVSSSSNSQPALPLTSPPSTALGPPNASVHELPPSIKPSESPTEAELKMMGIRIPDFASTLTVNTRDKSKGQNWFDIAADVGELKTMDSRPSEDRGNVVVLSAIGKALVYLSLSYELCGTYQAFAVVDTAFSRIVALDARTFVIEVSESAFAGDDTIAPFHKWLAEGGLRDCLAHNIRKTPSTARADDPETSTPIEDRVDFHALRRLIDFRMQAIQILRSLNVETLEVPPPDPGAEVTSSFTHSAGLSIADRYDQAALYVSARQESAPNRKFIFDHLRAMASDVISHRSADPDDKDDNPGSSTRGAGDRRGGGSGDEGGDGGGGGGGDGSSAGDPKSQSSSRQSDRDHGRRDRGARCPSKDHLHGDASELRTSTRASHQNTRTTADIFNDLLGDWDPAFDEDPMERQEISQALEARLLLALSEAYGMRVIRVLPLTMDRLLAELRPLRLMRRHPCLKEEAGIPYSEAVDQQAFQHTKLVDAHSTSFSKPTQPAPREVPNLSSLSGDHLLLEP